MKSDFLQDKCRDSKKDTLSKKEFKSVTNPFDTYLKSQMIMEQNRKERIYAYK